MPILEILGLLYAGTLIENPGKRAKFVETVNKASKEVEKMFNGVVNEFKTKPAESAVKDDEPSEFK